MAVDPLVSVDWLKENLERGDVRVLDGTYCLTGQVRPFPGQYIAGAQIFDIDKVADPDSHMTHMIPPRELFEQAVSEMGLKPSDHIIVYDQFGVVKSPRVWWMFRLFGHEKISVLDGGFAAWREAEGEISAQQGHYPPSEYKTSEPLSAVVKMHDVLGLQNNRTQIIDARSFGRFTGEEPETRTCLRSGHIPGSLSLPHTKLHENGFFKSISALKAIVESANIDLSRPIITSCGSGITACVLALTFERLGAENVSVYDGSWVEWGASDAPIETGSI